MAKEIKIHIASGFDPSGVSDASRALEKMAEDLEKSNKWLLQCNAELSQAMHKHAQSVAVLQKGYRINLMTTGMNRP